jgi:hypothetical protein
MGLGTRELGLVVSIHTLKVRHDELSLIFGPTRVQDYVALKEPGLIIYEVLQGATGY